MQMWMCRGAGIRMGTGDMDRTSEGPDEAWEYYRMPSYSTYSRCRVMEVNEDFQPDMPDLNMQHHLASVDQTEPNFNTETNTTIKQEVGSVVKQEIDTVVKQEIDSGLSIITYESD
ncbi:hypothetical protein C8R48DRAFT_674280 [Suillus tomentosus]|nr:hypothetical protein C8R48DRAFT_674280 [Suillus tomentosus]